MLKFRIKVEYDIKSRNIHMHIIEYTMSYPYPCEHSFNSILTDLESIVFRKKDVPGPRENYNGI
jgi:hypothetical protein